MIYKKIIVNSYEKFYYLLFLLMQLKVEGHNFVVETKNYNYTNYFMKYERLPEFLVDMISENEKGLDFYLKINIDETVFNKVKSKVIDKLKLAEVI